MARSAKLAAEAEQAARDAEFAKMLVEYGELIRNGKLYTAPDAEAPDEVKEGDDVG